MENINNNKAAEAAALLKQKEAELKDLPENATEEEKALALKEFDEAKKVFESLNTKTKKEGKVKMIALENLSGNYLLPWSKGQKFECDKKQAEELAENKAADYLK